MGANKKQTRARAARANHQVRALRRQVPQGLRRSSASLGASSQARYPVHRRRPIPAVAPLLRRLQEDARPEELLAVERGGDDPALLRCGQGAPAGL